MASLLCSQQRSICLAQSEKERMSKNKIKTLDLKKNVLKTNKII